MMLELVYKSAIRDMCDLNEHCLRWERTFIMDIFPLRHFPDTRMRWHDKKCKCCVAIGKQIAPTFLVRESVNLLLPLLTTLVNTSLMQGRLPASQKHAIVTPRLKRSGLDPTDIANFRPVPNLTFVLKVTERAAACQLNTYLSGNGLMPHHQSAYRKKHSTATTAILSV